MVLLFQAAIVVVAVGVACFLFAWITGMLRYIPNNRVGIVEKLVSPNGSVKHGFIALHGEAGFQPEVLRGGWHVFPPFQYRVHMAPLVTISQGHIGYFFARDGAPLAASQALASNANAADFTDVRGFLMNGGQRGPQRQLLREGTFAINLAQFVVLTDERNYFLPLERADGQQFQSMAKLLHERDGFRPVLIEGREDRVGVVTVHDGPPLDDGEIIAPTTGTEHNNFQDAERFLAAGGRRGRQLQVLTEGSWYLNRLFATVEWIPKTTVEVGHVGVVVSYTGEIGTDRSGTDYSHGETVDRGHRGVWSVPLLPGKYAFNTFAGRVISVPTTNFILKWIRNQVGAHGFDENLAEVSLITKDAFEPTLPLSVVVHIDYRNAPLVIQRFGDIQRLVEQTLDPMVSAYFKNIGQTRTLLQLLHDRSEIQALAAAQMREKFVRYNLELEEVLIGTPTGNGNHGAIEQILDQLRQRQIAEEQVATYQVREQAAGHERSLREAEARASSQTELTKSEVAITVQANQGMANYERSVKEAAQIRVLAEAEAEKVARIGIAQAMATEEQVRAFGGPQFQVASKAAEQLAKAIEIAKVDVVPRVVLGGGASSGNTAFESLIGMLLSEKFTAIAGEPLARNPAADTIRASIQSGIDG